MLITSQNFFNTLAKLKVRKSSEIYLNLLDFLKMIDIENVVNKVVLQVKYSYKTNIFIKIKQIFDLKN